MSRLTPSAVRDLVHQALVARVRVLLGQCDFDELIATQERVAQALAHGALHLHTSEGRDGAPAMAQAVLDAFGLDPVYYGDRELEFILSEGLAGAGVALAEVVRGHEQDSSARWQAEVVPELDRIEEFVVSVFDGRWSVQPGRLPLSDWLQG